jgi:hypothetical protein
MEKDGKRENDTVQSFCGAFSVVRLDYLDYLIISADGTLPSFMQQSGRSQQSQQR